MKNTCLGALLVLTFGSVTSSMIGSGGGSFANTVVAVDYCNHESKMADLDGNGTLDILCNPYTWNTPRLGIWLNVEPASAKSK